MNDIFYDNVLNYSNNVETKELRWKDVDEIIQVMLYTR